MTKDQFYPVRFCNVTIARSTPKHFEPNTLLFYPRRDFYYYNNILLISANTRFYRPDGSISTSDFILSRYTLIRLVISHKIIYGLHQKAVIVYFFNTRVTKFLILSFSFHFIIYFVFFYISARSTLMVLNTVFCFFLFFFFSVCFT